LFFYKRKEIAMSIENEEKRGGNVVNSEIGWEYTEGFLPKTEEQNPSSEQEPS
jgi:hypothetical protein